MKRLNIRYRLSRPGDSRNDPLAGVDGWNPGEEDWVPGEDSGR